MPDKRIKGGGEVPLSYNLKTAAAVLGISESNLRTLVREGLLPVVRLRGRILLPRESLLEFLRSAQDSSGVRIREIPLHIKKRMKNSDKLEVHHGY